MQFASSLGGDSDISVLFPAAADGALPSASAGQMDETRIASVYVS